MAWNFKDILRLVFFRFVYVIHIAYKISTLHIMSPGLNSYSPMDKYNILLLSFMVDSDACNIITIGGFHLHDWS